MSRELRALETTTTGQLDRGAALRRVLRIFWGEAEPALRRRIVAHGGTAGATALLNALVPLLFARAIDALAPGARRCWPHLRRWCSAYVVVQWLAKVLNELRWALYGPIEQRTRRRLARQALEHLHALSLSFHLARRTGQISRVLDKGLNGARELLFDGVFLILPLLGRDRCSCAAIMLARLDLRVRRHPRGHAGPLRRGPGGRARSGCARTSARPWPRARSRTARRSTAC